MGHLPVTANINCITRLRIHSDGEGVRSVIFFQGCPLDCFWCCNPETRHGSRFKTLTPGQLSEYILPDLPYFSASGGGVTFSGGEPLLWGDFLEAFLRESGGRFSADIETSLFADRETLTRLIPYIHQWNVDFKVFHPLLHKLYTGRSNRIILENLKYLANRIPAEQILITYPIIPGYNDSPGNIRKMTGFLHRLGLNQIELHPYRKFAEEKHRRLGLNARDVPTLTGEQLQRTEALFRDAGFTLVRRDTLYGKEKCGYLKQLRRDFCDTHGLSVEIADCKETAPCIGTCPRCEYELAQISLATRNQEDTENLLRVDTWTQAPVWEEIPPTRLPDAGSGFSDSPRISCIDEPAQIT